MQPFLSPEATVLKRGGNMLANIFGIFYLNLGILYFSNFTSTCHTPNKLLLSYRHVQPARVRMYIHLRHAPHMGSVVLTLTYPVQPCMIDCISDCKSLSFALKRPVRQCLLTTAWFLLRVIYFSGWNSNLVSVVCYTRLSDQQELWNPLVSFICEWNTLVFIQQLIVCLK